MEISPMKTEKRKAIVVGAGLVGLTTSAALAQRGWSVTVLERGSELREFGAGIWLWKNGLKAIEHVGALEDLMKSGPRAITGWEIRNPENRVVSALSVFPDYIPRREVVYSALLSAGTNLDVRFLTGINVHSVDSDSSSVIDEKGRRYTADLIVGADGINSKVRETLGLKGSRQDSNSHAMRLLIPRLPEDSSTIAEEHWSSNRTFLYCPVDGDFTYLCFGCSRDDTAARNSDGSINQKSWIASLPQVKGFIERATEPGRWDPLSTVKCSYWHRRNVAIVGDAASAMPPTLGQAANIGMVNAVALAQAVSFAPTVEEGLAAWDSACRPITEHVQTWSRHYSRVSHLLPEGFDKSRMRLVSAFGGLPPVKRALARAPHEGWKPVEVLSAAG